MKAGFKTTEFWVTILSAVISLLVILGVLTPMEGDTLQEAVVQAVAAILVLIAALAPIFEYIRSRTQVKVAYIENS